MMIWLQVHQDTISIHGCGHGPSSCCCHSCCHQILTKLTMYSEYYEYNEVYLLCLQVVHVAHALAYLPICM